MKMFRSLHRPLRSLPSSLLLASSSQAGRKTFLSYGGAIGLCLITFTGANLAVCEESKKTEQIGNKTEEEVTISRGTVMEGGREYKGQTSWWTGKPQGYGTMIFVMTGDIYEGYWYDGKFWGKGKFMWANGNRYEGDFKDGKMEGKGTLTYANGTQYEGEFKDDRPHGKGKFYELDGTVYEGEYKLGHRTGFGRYKSIDGSVYEGEWKNGQYHGQGKMTFADKLVYQGGYKEGQRHGKGVLIFRDGSKIECEFNSGMRVF
jgi:hypothetical protein